MRQTGRIALLLLLTRSKQMTSKAVSVDNVKILTSLCSDASGLFKGVKSISDIIAGGDNQRFRLVLQNRSRPFLIGTGAEI